MHPRLRRYVEPPPSRRLRHFLIGAVVGLAALFGGHALFERFVDSNMVVYSVRHDRSVP